MKTRFLSFASVMLLMLACWMTRGGHAAEVPDDTVAELVSMQGTVYIKMDDNPASPVQKFEELRNRTIQMRAGWTISTDKNTRCNLRLRDRSIITLGPYSTVRFAKKDQRVLTRMLRGVMSFFHRDAPGELEVESPQVAAVIYGTEFVFAVAENGTTTLTLYDGRVEMTGGLTLNGGDVAVAEPGKAPRKTAVIGLNQLDAIQWNLYYPAVLDLSELALEPDIAGVLAQSMQAYTAGDLIAALAAYPTNRQPASPRERVYYAALLLSVGNVTEAESWLTQPSSGSTVRLEGALRQLIASVTLRSVSVAGPASSTNLLATEWMALSYAQQGRADLAGARESARNAARQSPGFGFAWARLAELEFGFGRLPEAQAALKTALSLAPRHAQAHALSGFVACGLNSLAEALEAFERALALDSALGNAWLGRGLCRMRQCDVAGGRGDMEVAAAVEPQRALLRGYLGKAFFEEKHYEQALYELNLAMAKDPLDPTAWLYSALLKANRNRVNESVSDLERSKSLNDHRALYRSRLLLDQDQAVRGANLAGLYRDAGMTEVAVREANRAVITDYANASAHAFLANSYDSLRDPRQVNLRYETPWFSELLLANLLAPPGVGTLSQNVSQQEYSRLFDRNRVGLISTTEYSSQGDWIQTASQYGQYGRMSYALDVDYRDEHGQRINEDRQATAIYAKTKFQLTPQDSFLVMANTLDYHSGDLGQYYDARSANSRVRVAEYQDPNLFLGYHREWQPGSHTLFLFGRMDDTLRYDDPEASTLLLETRRSGKTFPTLLPGEDPFSDPIRIQYQRRFEAYSAELQQIWQPGSHTVVAGGRVQTGTSEVNSVFYPPSGLPAFLWFDPAPVRQSVNADFTRATLYLYDQWRACAALQVHVGLAYDRLDYPANIDWVPVRQAQRSADQVSPKVGFVADLSPNTHLNGAWTRSLGGVYYDQSIRLEPTQVGGFNQAYRSLIPESSPDAASGLAPGAEFETFGLALDHRFSSRTYASIAGEWLREEADRELGVFQSPYPERATPSHTLQKMEYGEQSLTTTLNQLLGQHWSVGLRHRVSLADLETRLPWLSAATLDNYLDTTRPIQIDGSALLHEARLFTIWNHPSGLYWRFDAHWHTQSNDGSYAGQGMGREDLWQFDAHVGYRFWQRRATAQVGILNLTGRDYQLNPLSLHQELPRERTFTAQLKLAF